MAGNVSKTIRTKKVGTKKMENQIIGTKKILGTKNEQTENKIIHYPQSRRLLIGQLNARLPHDPSSTHGCVNFKKTT